MKASVVNGNGCICNKCHTILYPDDAIKLKAFVLAGSTGEYIVKGKADLCDICYNKILGEIMEESVRRNNEVS